MLICMQVGMACTAQGPLSQEDSLIAAVEADGGSMKNRPMSGQQIPPQKGCGSLD